MKICLQLLISIFVIATIEGCDSIPLPAAQLDFKKEIETLQTEYDQAKNSGNSILEKQVEEKAIIFLRNTPHKAVEWVAVIDSISNDQLTVSTESDPYRFHLGLFVPEAIILVKSLERGDSIKFSGDIGTEKSVTIGEGISEPQFKFYPESIQTGDGRKVATQDIQNTTDQASIKKLQDEAKCVLDLQCWADHHLKAAASQCQKSIEKMAKYNYKWTNGILEPIFSQHKWFDAEQLYISYLGDKITLQNGYDEWGNQKYSCVFDTLNDIIIKVGILPGSF